MVEHVDLTDPELHEPKGAASASSGDVYISDGAGSGAWGTVTFDVEGVEVVVTSSSDFPVPSSNVITLASNTVYRISGSIDIDADRIVLGNNSAIVGSDPDIDKIITTNTGTVITSAGSGKLKDMSIDCSAGTAFSFSGSSLQSVLLDNVVVVACTTVGSISGYGHVGVDLKVTSATTDGLSFAGTLGTAMVTVRGSSWTGTLLDLDTAVFDHIVIGPGGVYDTASGNTGISVAASSANIDADGLGIITKNRFSGAGTNLSGYAATDVRWIVESNSDLTSSYLTVQDHLSSATYTPSNVTTTRTYDADASTTAELADVLGTLIADLQAIDIIQ